MQGIGSIILGLVLHVRGQKALLDKLLVARFRHLELVTILIAIFAQVQHIDIGACYRQLHMLLRSLRTIHVTLTFLFCILIEKKLIVNSEFLTELLLQPVKRMFGIF